jgi:hypothetical protein
MIRLLVILLLTLHLASAGQWCRVYLNNYTPEEVYVDGKLEDGYWVDPQDMSTSVYRPSMSIPKYSGISFAAQGRWGGIFGVSGVFYLYRKKDEKYSTTVDFASPATGNNWVVIKNEGLLKAELLSGIRINDALGDVMISISED